MSRSNILIYIAIVAAIIAFGQYQKEKFIKKVSPIIPPPNEFVAPIATKLNKPQKNQVSPSKTSPIQEVEKKQTETITPVKLKNEVVEIAPTNLPVPTATIPNDTYKKNYETNQKIVSTDLDSSSVKVETPPPPELEIYLPEKTNLTKEEKITEIKILASIFNAQLVHHYKDIDISYIQGDFKVGVLLGDSIEYYEDPAAFEKKSSSSFIKSTMEFIELVQQMRREAHQRYLKNNNNKIL